MLSERLKRARKNINLTQLELAKKIKTTKGTISNYENGHSTPNNEMLKDLADALDVTTDYLLGRTNDPSGFVNKGDNNNYDSLSELNKLIKEYGIEQMGFFDIEKWKKLGPEQIEELKNHFEWVVAKAKQLEEDKK